MPLHSRHPELEPPATINVPALEIAESGGLILAAPAATRTLAPTYTEGSPVRSLYLDAALSQTRQFLADSVTKVSDAPGAARAIIVESEGDTLLIGGQVVGRTSVRAAYRAARIAVEGSAEASCALGRAVASLPWRAGHERADAL